MRPCLQEGFTMSQTVINTPPRNSAVAAPSRERRAPAGRPFLRPLAWLWGSVPTLLVLATFGGLFYYGHHFDWKLPKFSALAGAEAAKPADWCEEHGVPESQCVECNPDLMPKGPDYGWCPEHGVHNCVLHHPHVAQLKETPVVSDSDLDRAARALALRPRPENNAVCKVYQRRIQFASVESVKQAGVDVELVERQPISEWVSGNGEITYDATRLASLSSRVPGTAWRVLKNIGDRVREGDVLAVVDAMEVGRTKSDLVKALVAEDLARQTLDRLKGLTSGVVAGRQVLEAEAAFAQAEAEVLSAEQSLANLGLRADVSKLRGLSKKAIVDRLRFLGLPDDLVSQFDSQTATANLIPIRSPMDGVIVDRQVAAGEVVDPTRTLFQVADPSQMWLTLNIPLEEARFLSVGQPVRFRPDGSPNEVTGKLTWISTAADKQTRMVKVRAELPNPDGQLRDETFGTGRVVLREEQEAIVVPKEAIHWEGCCHVVFVRDKGYFDSPESPKVFHVRSVRMGAKNGKSTEIIAGVLPGEVVVTKGSDVLRAQLLKNNLGEGCACVAE
jgi:cobalt-zinc-cadmium efflux system membrane fusion protein